MSLDPHRLLLPTLATLLVVVALTGSAALAHFAARRERARRRERLTDLARDLEAFAEGTLHAEDLAEALGDADPETFWSALETWTLGRRLPLRVARALRRDPHARGERRALRDDSPWRRELAARRLGLLPSIENRRALRRALTRGPETVTLAAARALARHADLEALDWLVTHPKTLAHRTPRSRFELFRAFGRRGHPRLHAALERTGGLDPSITRAILDTLGDAAYGVAAPAIALRLMDPNPELRIAAARALGRLGATDASPALIHALNDAEWAVRAQAARALGRCGNAQAIAPLGAALEDRAWWVRRHAAFALAQLGSAGRAELARIAAKSEDRYAREMADEALNAG